MGADARGRLAAELKRCTRLGIDTNACVYFLGQLQPYASLVRMAFDLAADGDLEIELPGIAQAEMMVHPYKYGSARERSIVLAFMEMTPGLRLAPMTREVLFAGAQVRSMTSLKLPDALVVASCAVGRCDAIIGNDTNFRAVNALGEVELVPGPGQRFRIPRYLHLDDYAGQAEALPAAVE